jgi:ABC-2 type transport system ATP-binding protein
LGQQATFIISSHNLEVIEDLCQQIINLGKVRLQSREAVSELTVRTKALTFKLKADPSANVADVFKDLAAVTEVRAGSADQHRLVNRFNDEQDPMAEIEIIKCLGHRRYRLSGNGQGRALTRLGGGTHQVISHKVHRQPQKPARDAWPGRPDHDRNHRQ